VDETYDSDIDIKDFNEEKDEQLKLSFQETLTP
jgi:hypothetical protein